jgi:hypothetical protein
LVALLADLSGLLALLSGRHWFLTLLLRVIALLLVGLLQFLFFLPIHWLLLRAFRPSQKFNPLWLRRHDRTPSQSPS